MSRLFPKRCVMSEGSIYTVLFEQVWEDWCATVRQFDDLTPEKKQALMDNWTHEDADIWWSEQWVGGDIISQCTLVGVDEVVRERFIKQGLFSGSDEWATEFENDE